MNFQEISEFDLGSFWRPGVVAPQLSVKLEKSENLMRGGAMGATEARNKLGMLVVMSLQLSMAIGGVQMRFSENLQKVTFF